METQAVIMVEVAAREWTQEALHSACNMARRSHASVALVQMVPVRHPLLLGTQIGYQSLSEAEIERLCSYEETLEDYGVEYSITLFQYATLVGAIVEAADLLNARVVFAALPKNSIPFWPSIRLEGLRRSLAQHQRQLVLDPALSMKDTGLDLITCHAQLA